MSKNLISVVIPTLNEEENIGKVINEVKSELERYGYKYEIIVVDGYSTDGTVEIAKKHGAKVIFDSMGKGSALRKVWNMQKAA